MKLFLLAALVGTALCRPYVPEVNNWAARRHHAIDGGWLPDDMNYPFGDASHQQFMARRHHAIDGGWLPDDMNYPFGDASHQQLMLAGLSGGGGFDAHGNGHATATVPVGGGSVSGTFGHSSSGNTFGVGGEIPVGNHGGFVSGGVTHTPNGDNWNVGGGFHFNQILARGHHAIDGGWLPDDMNYPFGDASHQQLMLAGLSGGGGFDAHGNGHATATVPVGGGSVSGTFGHSSGGNTFGVGGEIPVGNHGGFVTGGVTHTPNGDNWNVGGGFHFNQILAKRHHAIDGGWLPDDMNYPFGDASHQQLMLAGLSGGGGFDAHGNGHATATVPVGGGSVSGTFGHSPGGNTFGVGGEIPVGNHGGFVTGGVTHTPNGDNWNVGGGFHFNQVEQRL